jgi:DNA-binding winged helix-turn-helix (wHTH) protein
MPAEAKFPGIKVLYAFDDFRVDPLNRELLRDGKFLPLTARVFDILLYFVENNGRLLEKKK